MSILFLGHHIMWPSESIFITGIRYPSLISFLSLFILFFSPQKHFTVSGLIPPRPLLNILMSLQSGCKPWAGRWRSGRMDFQGKPCRRSRRWRLSWTNWRRKGPRSSFSWTPWRLLCKNRNKKLVFKRDCVTEFNTLVKRLWHWTTFRNATRY